MAPSKVPVDTLTEAAAPTLRIPWGHNILLLQKVKDVATRRWYMQQTVSQGWSRNVLDLMIKSRAHERQGAACAPRGLGIGAADDRSDRG